MTILEISNWPLVSVIIPAYNYGQFVLSAIDSVKRQDYPHIEIIVVDDGSTDNTPQLLSSLTSIIYVRQQNQGLSAARNHGIRLASGKYLQFLDADDLLGSTSIRKRVEFLEQNPDKSAVICRSAFFRGQVYPQCLTFWHTEWRQPEAGQVDLALYYFNIAPPHAFLVRKSVIDKNSLLFDTSLRACEDYDFWFRLAQVSGVPGMVQSCWVYYRQHENSMSRSYTNQYRHDAELCKRILANADSGRLWLGSRPPTDYLAAMFAASLLTARRLWYVDRLSYTDFLTGHVLRLQKKLEQAQREFPATIAAQIYLAQIRLILLKMWFRDYSIDRTLYDKLNNFFSYRKSFFASAIDIRAALPMRIVARLLKLDLHYACLMLLSSTTR